MNIMYPAVFHKEDNAYWVEFPDLCGCQSYGDTLGETMENAKEALAAYCITLIDEKRKLPKVSELEEIDADGGIIALVETNLTNLTKSVKKTLTIPAWLNKAAEERHVNFSDTLQKALIETMGL